MARKQEYTPIQWKTPESPSPSGMGNLTRSFSSMLAKTNTPTWEERKLGERVRSDLAKQLGTAIKKEHGDYLAKMMSLNTIRSMDEYIAEEREIREKERHSEDQADMEAFCHVVREGAGNSFLAIRQAAVNQVETIVTTPLDLPEEQADEMIITQQPGFMQRLFGGGIEIKRGR